MSIWTTKTDEQALADRLVATGRVATSVVGESADGGDILAWRIGGDALSPPTVTDPASLLYVGCQHGDEPAGREGLLALAQYLTDVHLDLTGTAGDYSSTPDAASLKVTGDLTLRCGVLTDQWGVAGGNRYLISKYTTTGDQRSYALRCDTNGDLELVWSTDGTSGGILVATATEVPVPNYYGVVFVAASIDVDNGASGRTITFYTAPSMDGPWDQLGDEVVQAGATSIHSGTAVLELGTISAGATSAWAAQILAARVEDGGSVVADPDFTTQTIGGTSFADSTGKTWTVHGSASIAAAATSTERTFLDDHGVLMIPTANPDGFPSSRLNGDGDDINRRHIDLAAPEAEAIASVLAATTPLVVADLHEFGSGFATEDILFAEPRHPAAYSGIVTSSNTLIGDLETRATAESWTFADYPTNTSQLTSRLLVSNSGLRHSVAVLIETRETADDDAGQTARTDIHYGLADEILTHVITNRATLATGQTTAQDAKEAEGAAGTAAFNLGPSDTIDPPPLGYLLVGVAPALHLSLFNITVTNGDTVSMEQASQPVIPLLLDTESEVAVASGVRLFSLPEPTPPATVAELAPIVSGPHRIVVEARVLESFQVGDNPSGTMIGIISGDVILDATADVFGSVTLETEGTDERGDSLFPRRAGDLLAPYGNELFVRRGVDIGSETLWSPLGYFRIDDAEQSPASDAPIRLSGQDRMAAIVDARVVEPFQFPSSRTIGYVVERLVTQVYPSAVIVFDDDSSEQTIGRQLVVEESRYDALRDIAESLGKVIYWDGQGLLRIEEPPATGDPIWDVKAGHGGVLVSAGRSVSRRGMKNGFKAVGEGASERPVRAIVVDTGVNSPTRWPTPGDSEARFGRVPGFYNSPLLTNEAQARDAATSLLRRHIGMPYSVNFGAIPNPALRPYDPIRITHKDGTRELHIVETVTVPLTAQQAMTGTTREQTNVAIGTLETTGELQ